LLIEVPELYYFLQNGLGKGSTITKINQKKSQNYNFHYEENTMNIYVGNLALNVSETDLQQVFQAFGEVESVKIIKDRYSGESRGFGFVEMPSGAEAQSAMNGLNGKELKGLTIKVNQARPQKNKSRRGFRGYN
jgi:RNA recognition motif-containing protein